MVVRTVGNAGLYEGLREALDEALARELAEGPGALGELLGALDAEGRRGCALALHATACRDARSRTEQALADLSGQELGWSTEESDALLARLVGKDAKVAPHELESSFRTLVAVALSAAEQAEDFDRARVRALRRTADSLHTLRAAEFAPLRDRMDALLRREAPVTPGRLPRHLLDRLDDFGPAMRAAHEELLAGAGVAAFLGHCVLLDKPRATRAWRRTSAALLGEAERGAEVVRRLLEGVAAQPEHRISDLGPWGTHVRGLTGDTNTSLVRGLLWAALDLPDAWVVPLAGAVALNAGTGLGGSGGTCRSQPLATAAVAVLGECGDARGEEAVQWLGRLAKQVRNRTVAKGIAKALEAVAARSGVTPSMLRERGVPTLGLDGRGIREESLGAFTAELAVREPGTVVLSFRGPEGRVLKTAPRSVREGHREALKRVGDGLKELRALVAAERSRLEEHLAAGTCRPAEDWQRYYVDHPVTGAMARALLWEVAEDGPADGPEGGGGRWTAGLPERTGGGWALAAADGTARPVGAGDRLRLWHPLRADADEVAEWRAEVTVREERQPFKQVFREVYRPLPEEPATGPYTNRFAGHVLRYGQARALMAERGWAGDHLGYFSDGASSEMVKELPVPGDLPAGEGTHWRARFFVELVDEGVSRDGVALLCATDRVRFDRRSGAAGARGAWAEAALADVPALVLSEALRDVDLFVGVASVGADPDRRDRGEDRAHDGYRERWAFGELSEPARIRREALARLLPRTGIAGRAELTDRFLRVRGEVRTYRIHLGSGSVLMEPSDTYLAVDADRAARGGGRVFLPFEEDGGMLSVILSKAVLLAADDRITDPVLAARIRRSWRRATACGRCGSPGGRRTPRPPARRCSLGCRPRSASR
ncbi:DUF4132 domain-containing protein, partial [Streptomyces sp. NPDC056361]|uniref:DUF4132 domain-containing protein n=1 Tax=Streptomyces sp. NPDC056361 TaxID=3345795 RepID=UPI0035D591A6